VDAGSLIDAIMAQHRVNAPLAIAKLFELPNTGWRVSCRGVWRSRATRRRCGASSSRSWSEREDAPIITADLAFQLFGVRVLW